MEKFISKKGNLIKIIKTNINLIIGEKKNFKLLDNLGKIISLENNLIASLNGCNNPT